MKILITYDLEDEYIQRIRSTFPATEVTKALEARKVREVVSNANVILAGRFNAEILGAAKSLRWIQSIGAGVEEFLFPEFVDSNVILTNAKGIHPKQISDHVFGLMLAFSRRLHLFMRFQLQNRWEKLKCDELAGKTLGIVGLGNIGMEIARKAKCFGMTIIATKKTRSTRPVYVDELLPHTGLREMLQRSDFVVVAVPLTPETHHLIGKGELQVMRRDSYLINISRGEVIDEKVLIQALKEGRIGGAGLDVFEKEPLPSDSELWGLENVIITPHIAGSTPYYSQRVCELFIENLKRFNEGRPLINVVDKRAGY